ncbi:MAG TPA: hypothetical protein VFG60_09850 [Burkholderiaceae bacterium]|nr:hypothetical protein [Burkholderiaceae bacterium]
MSDRAKWSAFEQLSIDEFAVELQKVMSDMADLLQAKRSAYGPSNLTEFGDIGVLIRTNDKIKRLIHMHREGIDTTAVGEDALDAWRDIAGYALLVLVADFAERESHA